MLFFVSGRDGILPKAAEDTATFLSFMDQVFDSVNGLTFEAGNGKELRCAIKQNTTHLKFWDNCIKTFQSMQFITLKKGRILHPQLKTGLKHYVASYTFGKNCKKLALNIYK